jgi:hypothetical protein
VSVAPFPVSCSLFILIVQYLYMMEISFCEFYILLQMIIYKVHYEIIRCTLLLYERLSHTTLSLLFVSHSTCSLLQNFSTLELHLLPYYEHPPASITLISITNRAGSRSNAAPGDEKFHRPLPSKNKSTSSNLRHTYSHFQIYAVNSFIKTHSVN